MNKLLVILILSISNFTNAQDCQYLGIDKEFKKGEIVYLFGDNVRLRTEPSSLSEIVNNPIKIGATIEIIEKTDVVTTYKGIASYWYKVKHQYQIGYVLSGLISQIKATKNGLHCFIGLEKTNDILHIVTRILADTIEGYTENKSVFLGDNNGFCLKLFDNKGLPGVNNILFINYIPESGGANAGGYYLFFDSKELHKIIEIFSSNDIGLWEKEQLYFPTDSLGVKDKIIYIKEEGEFSDNENKDDGFNWEKSSKIKLQLEWINNKLEPNPKKVTLNESK